MMFIRITATESFPGSFDTLAMLIGEERDMVFAFNGFMNSMDDFDSFSPEEMIIYKGRKAREIFSSHRHKDANSRNIELTDDLKMRVVDWMMQCEHLVLM